MKLAKLLIVGWFAIFISVLNVDAYSTSLKGSTSITAGEEVTITVNVSGAENLWGTMGKLTYDSSKLTFVSSASKNNYTVTVGSNFVADAVAGKSGSFSIATITFKATSSFAIGEKTTITLGSQEGSNGIDAITGTGSSITITMSAPKSTNNYLSSLTLSSGKINFKKNTTSYTITVDNAVSSLEIKATAEDSKASLTGTGKKTLSVYKNTFKVVVAAESGAKKTYTIVVNRKDEDGNTSKLSSDNALDKLTITGHDIDFKSDVLEYTIDIDSDIEDIEILTDAKDSKATVKVNKPDEFVTGENIITVDVTSQSGETRTYTIIVNKSDDIEEPIIEEDKSSTDCNQKTKCESSSYKIVAIIETILFVIILIVLSILLGTKKLVIRRKRKLTD